MDCRSRSHRLGRRERACERDPDSIKVHEWERPSLNHDCPVILRHLPVTYIRFVCDRTAADHIKLIKSSWRIPESYFYRCIVNKNILLGHFIYHITSSVNVSLFFFQIALCVVFRGLKNEN